MKSHILWHLHKTNTFHKAGSLTICYGSFQGSNKLARTFRTFKPAAQGFFSGTVLYFAFSAVPQFFPHVKYPAQTPLRQQCLYKPCNSSRMGHGAINFSLRHFQQRPAIFCGCPFSPFSRGFCTSKTAPLRARSTGRPFSYSPCSLAARARLRAQNAHSPASRALAAVSAAPAASPGGQ